MTDTKFVRGSSKLLNRINTIRLATGVLLSSDRVGELIAERTRKRFERQVDPDNVPWAALSQITVADKKKRGYDPRILHRKLHLRQAIGVIRGASTGLLAISTGTGVRIGVKDTPTRYSPTGLTLAKPTEYGRWHQLGLGVPQRRFLGIGKLDVKAVDSLLRREIVKRAGLT